MKWKKNYRKFNLKIIEYNRVEMYQNGKIYRIDCNITGEVYIGSTCQATVAKRMAQHVSGFKTWKKTGKGFVTSYPIIERDNYNITLLEAIQCNTKDELKSREGYFIRTMVCVNKAIAGRSKQEYYEANKEHLLEQMKDNYEANKEKHLEKNRDYYEANKEHLLEQQKEYRVENRDQIAEQQKEYYDANKETILEKKKVYYEARKEEIKIYQKQHREKKRLEKL